jgi:large subunit ribosomal protein L5e
MGFTKVVKNKAYYKRFQVKFRRRREGKTDYYARQRLIIQDKNKYATPKYRFIVRLTNREVICQLAFAKIEGDVIVASAYSRELKKHGVSVGLKNYAAAYATGLLLARRHLTKLGLSEQFAGNTELGKEYHPPVFEDGKVTRRPFKAVLDVGLRRTTTGARLFASLKGASDGGLNIPHSTKRFVGSTKKDQKDKEAVLRSHILGGHVAGWMRILQKKDDGSYQKHFSQYIKAGLEADALEKTWLNVHASIRKNPVHVSTRRQVPESYKAKRFTAKRFTLAERKERVARAVAARDSAVADD